MSSFIIKCKRTEAIFEFDSHNLEIFKSQFYKINGYKDNFYNYYEIINCTPLNSNMQGSQPTYEFTQHEVGRYLPPTLEDDRHGFPPLNIFFLNLFD